MAEGTTEAPPARGEVTGERKIAEAFAAAHDQGRAALMPYMMGGFPDQEGATAIARAYVEGGADLIELGVPFSDPLADGPVIHGAATRALDGGATLDSVLRTCEAVADRVPVVAMCYANMAMAIGASRFADRLAEAGAAGAIVPDLPFEEAGAVGSALQDRGLAMVLLVAPTTPAERRRAICERSRGFVYVVSTVGVTGERQQLPPELERLVASVKKEASVPAAVGFGVATAEQAAAVGELADGVIIGSRLVRAAADAADVESAAREVRALLEGFAEAIRR